MTAAARPVLASDQFYHLFVQVHRAEHLGGAEKTSLGESTPLVQAGRWRRSHIGFHLVTPLTQLRFNPYVSEPQLHQKRYIQHNEFSPVGGEKWREGRPAWHERRQLDRCFCWGRVSLLELVRCLSLTCFDATLAD